MLLRADARCRKTQARLLFGERDELVERVDAERGMDGEHDRLVRQLDDRRQCLQRVDAHFERVRRAGNDVCGDKDGVTVRCALGRALDSDQATASRLVFHEDMLAEHARQILTDHARRDVRRAAWRIRHDESDRSRRIVEGRCELRGSGRRGGSCGELQE